MNTGHFIRKIQKHINCCSIQQMRTSDSGKRICLNNETKHYQGKRFSKKRFERISVLLWDFCFNNRDSQILIANYPHLSRNKVPGQFHLDEQKEAQKVERELGNAISLISNGGRQIVVVVVLDMVMLHVVEVVGVVCLTHEWAQHVWNNEIQRCKLWFE
jgi:hypothetical protein